MVNCGGTIVEQRDLSPDYDDGTWTWKDGSAARDATISALGRVFPEVNLLKFCVFLCLHYQKKSIFPTAILSCPLPSTSLCLLDHF